MKGFEFLHIRFLRGPADSEALCRIGFWNLRMKGTNQQQRLSLHVYIELCRGMRRSWFKPVEVKME
jgi:hypothetical protein